MKTIWVDTDMGFDDMLAILMVEHSERKVAGCSLVFGNSRLDQVCRNAAGMAAMFDWSFPIHKGAAGPILGDPVTAENVLGPTGLPSTGRNLAEAGPLPERAGAIDAMAIWLRQNASADFLALGPLTNIAVLILAYPDLIARIAKVTWMGGGATSGNHTASAEFNAFADPEALAIVLASGLSFDMVDLDACRQVQVSPEDLSKQSRESGRNAAVLHDLLAGYMDIGISRGRPSMALYDPVAAAAAIDGTAVTFQAAGIDVELYGNHTRGRTIVSRDGGAQVQTRIAISADAAKIRALAFDALRRGAGS